MSFLHTSITFLSLLGTVQHVYADPVTIDLGPPSAYVTSTVANGPLLPTGSSLSLHQASNGDVDLYLGPDLITQLGTTLGAKCPNNGPDCESSIQSDLIAADYELQSRQVGLILAAGGVLLAGFAYEIKELWNIDNNRPIPVHLNFPAAQVSSATANPSATEAVFKTADSDSGLDVPVTDIPSGTGAASGVSTVNTATLTTGVVVTQATDSANGHKPGDFLFQIKDQGALTWLQQKSQSSASCSGGSKKSKRDGYGCAVPAATDAMGALDGPLASLLLIGPAQLPRFVNGGDLARAVQGIFDSGRAIAALVTVPDAVLWALAEMFLYFFDEAINHAVQWAIDEFIPEDDFQDATAATSAPSATASGPCPTGSNKPACEDADCSGDDKIATCTASGSNSACACAPLVTPFINSVDVGWLLGQAQILSTMHTTDGGGSSAAKPTCMADGAPWLDPTSFCDCGPSSTYSTLPATSGGTSANCAYTTLPSNKITPTSKAGVTAPTNVPGQNGVPGCAAVIYPDGQACPYANYCNCGGTAVPFLTTTISGSSTTNCDYTIQPTATSCPPPSTTPSSAPPSTTAQAGPTNSCNPTDGSSYKPFARDKVVDKITALCQKYHDDKLVLSQGGIVLPPSKYDDDEQFDGMSADGSTAVFNPIWALDGCKDPSNPTPLDFGAMSVTDCLGYFLTAVDDCPNFTNPNNDEYWKYGGTNQAGCGFWTVRAM